MPSAQQLVADGDLDGALAALTQEVRANAADAKRRVFLFQLLCVMGQWQRALTQLNVCGELDAGMLAMVSTYREALQCEALREAVFAGRTAPHVFGPPQPWVALLAQALQLDAAGDGAAAAAQRQRAFDAAPATAGSLNGTPFEWIADADSRLGPVLEAIVNGRYCWVPFDAVARVVVEAPADLRDLVWAPATLVLANGGDTVALLPSRYAGSGAEPDGALRLARRTDWLELAENQFRGSGQKQLVTDQAELGLLEVREIVLRPAAAQPT